MKHCNPTGSGFFELHLHPKGPFVRIDLERGTVTTAFKDWFSWHWDTEQRQVSDDLIHFIEPDGRIVGTLSMAGGVHHA